MTNAIVQEAVTWSGTPYVNHAGIKGAGADCAFFPCRVYQAVGLIPEDFEPPKYSPQAWLNSPRQVDKFHLRVVDTTFLDVVEKFFTEITEAEVQPGDLIIYKVVNSWTHGAIVVDYPENVLHAVVGRGVISSHATKEGFLQAKARRYFRIAKEGE